MRIEEKIARNLFITLNEHFKNTGIEIHIDGAGVHWHVDATQGGRLIRIHCFHYGDSAGVLHLGMRGNAHLSKVRVGQPPTQRVGVEYYAEFQENDHKHATCRTSDLNGIISATEDWLIEEVAREGLYAKYSFVDHHRRMLLSIAQRVNSELESLHANTRITIEQSSPTDEFCELWIYSENYRSCRVMSGTNTTINCAFLDQRTQLAHVESIEASQAAYAINLWVNAQETVEHLKQAVSNVESEMFAECFERGDYSTWHWKNVLQQAEYDEILRFYQPLILRIAQNNIVSRFFSFTSLHRLCFSRCSLYPFDTTGLPILWPSQDDLRPYILAYEDNMSIQGTEDEIIRHLEHSLCQESIRPYFGNVNDRLLEVFNAQLINQGSHLRAQRKQRRQWLDIVVNTPDGRTCQLSTGSNTDEVCVVFMTEDDQKLEYTGGTTHAASKVVSWLETD